MPSYAATVWVAMINHLKKCWDLMLSFDGGKLGKKKFYSIHATTPNHQSFCLDLHDVTQLSQTGDYIFDLLKKVPVCRTSLRFIVMFLTVYCTSSGLTKLAQTAGVVLHQTMLLVVTRPKVYLSNIIQESLIWQTLAIIFTTCAKISAIYLNSKKFFFFLFS